MTESTVTRLTISWSNETDRALRAHLGAQGLKKGSLSQFIEEAVRWRLFNQTVEEARGAFADVAPEEIEGLLSEALGSVRAGRKATRQYTRRK